MENFEAKLFLALLLFWRNSLSYWNILLVECPHVFIHSISVFHPPSLSLSFTHTQVCIFVQNVINKNIHYDFTSGTSGCKSSTHYFPSFYFPSHLNRDCLLRMRNRFFILTKLNFLLLETYVWIEHSNIFFHWKNDYSNINNILLKFGNHCVYISRSRPVGSIEEYSSFHSK